MSVYQGNFTCWKDVQDAYETDEAEEGKTVIHAVYDTPDYEGWSRVLWVQDGRFWLVEGSHCSCMGLEGQFDPVETPVEVLRRMVQADAGLGDALRGFLDEHDTLGR